jgi:hypothetical protein
LRVRSPAALGCSDTDGIIAEETRRLVRSLNLPVDLIAHRDGSPGAGPLPRETHSGSPRPHTGPGTWPGQHRLLVDLLLLHRLAQLLVFLDGHDHRYHLAAVVNHVVGVTDRRIMSPGCEQPVSGCLTWGDTDLRNHGWAHLGTHLA